MSAARPSCARSPSVARRQYGHAMPGEEVGHRPGMEALLDFIWMSVSWCEFLSRFFFSSLCVCERENYRAAPGGERLRYKGR